MTRTRTLVGVALSAPATLLALLALSTVTVPAAAAGQAPPAAAPPATFTRDVAPILYENCVYCHRPGEVAPMSLLTYRDARPWARAIRQEVLQRRMPPWLADPHYGDFQSSRRLTDTQVQTLVAWVDGGAVEGDPADMPVPPAFSEGWQIGEPDIILTMAEPFALPAAGTIPYVDAPSNEYVFLEDVWVQAIEVRPGNRAVVHHAVASAVFPPGSECSGLNSNLHLYSPGLEAMIWRDGYGKRICKGTRIRFSMHYNAIGKAATDQSRIGFRIARAPVHTEVRTTIVMNTAMLVPPMVQNHEVIAALQFPVSARLHGLRPHMHLRARTSTASLIYPDGLRRVLLHIPRWDDSWQNYYVLSEPAPLPANAILEYVAGYDNSPANPLNPDPQSPVAWGQQVWEEMHSVYVTWTEVNEHNAGDSASIQIPVKTLYTTGATR
jgi:hypothetical protein